ncbi:MAG TPA: TAXI family TRAP transporter solute-binding subunit, partial [Nannocystaceae bacterium]|nr:TAXI family TRAP transporter solute-binding subunit [Nannocystaceae bacterium]
FVALESPGSGASVDMLTKGEVELALVSNHVAGASEIQLVTPLYQETLQVVVRTAAGIATPHDLAGKRVSVGAAGSGTESIADAVLLHFGIDASELDRRNMSTADATAALEGGQLDAAFIVGGMRTPAVDYLLQRDDMALLSLGEPGQPGSALEGIRLDAPFFTVTAVPEHAYGRQPTEPIGTISVHALLVVRADLDEKLVFELTESLFGHKVELAAQERLLSHLSERYDPALSPYPVHPGADHYYRRDEPSFVQKYMNELTFAITVGALLWSAFSALRAARRQKQRSRVENHLIAARNVVSGIGDADQAALLEARKQLLDAREKAIGELADEKLDANDAFAILLDYLGLQIEEIDRRLATLNDARV